MIIRDVHRWDTEFALDLLDEYMNLIEAQYETIRVQEKLKIPPKPHLDGSDDEFRCWEVEIGYFEMCYERDFPSKIRYSFIVLIYIVVEARLRAVCDEIANRERLSLRMNDLSGGLIEKAKKFLDKVAKIPVEEQRLWQWLDDFRYVRNCIVHENGQINISKHKHLDELCKQGQGLSKKDGSLFVEREYCAKALSCARNFFEQIFTGAGFGPSVPDME